MYATKALLYSIIVIAQIFTALAAPDVAKFPHDTGGGSSPKSDDSFANEHKDLKVQVKGEIDKSLKKR